MADAYRFAPELTVYQARETATALAEALARDCTTFDVSGIAEIDGAGLQVLVSLQRLADEQCRPIVWAGTSEAFEEACRTGGWTRATRCRQEETGA